MSNQLQHAYLEVETGARIDCMFNPTTFAFSTSNSWNGSSEPGKDTPSLRFAGGGGGTFNLSLVFDTTPVGTTVTEYTNKLLNLMKVDPELPGYDEAESNGRPPWVKFHWGTHVHSFRAVINSTNVTFTYFSAEGTPLRANVELSLTQFEPDDNWGAQNPTSGTPKPRRTHQVQVGDTLDRIAARYYGDSTRWRDIASINGIADPLDLAPETALDSGAKCLMVTRTTVDTPSIQLNGSEVDTTFLTNLVVTQTLGAAADASLRLDKAEDAVTKFTVGADIVVKAPSWGSTGASGGTTMVQVFSGVIVSVGLDWRANRSELIVDVYDKSHKLAQKTLVSTYLDQKPSQIIQTLASGAGLTSDIASSFGQVQLPFVQQHGTAHQFITELVHNEGHEWWMDDTKLIVKRRSDAGAAVATLGGTGYVMRRFHARFSALDRTKAVNVRGWDPAAKQALTASANGMNAGAPSTPSITQGIDPPSGEATSWPRRVVTTNNEATNAAAGIAARMGASLVSARGECDLAVAVRPGAIVKVEGVNTKWNGNYYITESEHVFGDGQPFVTRFVAGGSDDESIAGLLNGSASGHGARLADGLTIGIVTNNDDANAPDGSLGRVKVRFPYLSDQDESAWARLVAPGAGASRGLHVMPEVDDEVLVGFENGDIRRPYVLGGLWNGSDAQPFPTSEALDNGGVKTRSFTTRRGHFLSFIDGGSNTEDKIELALKSSRATLVISGEKIDLLTTEDKPITVKTSAASIEIASGGDITLKGKNITLDAQTTITLKGTDVKIDAKAGIDAKANAKVSVKGTGGVDVDGSPALTNVKGSMVMIN